MLSPNSIGDQKKGLYQKLQEFNSIEDQKKGLHRNLILYSAENWNLIVLTATFSSNHPDAYSIGERTAISLGGTLQSR